MNSNGETYYGFLLQNGTLCCIHMCAVNSHFLSGLSAHNHQANAPIRFELNQPNIVKRLWSGLTR